VQRRDPEELTMTPISATPDVSGLEIPTDRWTQPFWDAAAEERLILPHCTSCGTHRWPPGPFCPVCSGQEVGWSEAGAGRVYSYTVAPRFAEGGQTQAAVPALIEFPEAGGVRLIAAIVETPIADLAVGAPVQTLFSQAANGKVPVFRVVPGGRS
jgi:uncharacterized OB-fold protein